MSIPYYQANAFTTNPFGGNPAGVCLLESWLRDDLLQEIAAENNLSETAFLAEEANGYALRWFTPRVEVDLCGHATLASAFVIFSEIKPQANVLNFQTRSGEVAARRAGNLVELDFPSWVPEPVEAPDALLKGLGQKPIEVLKSRDYLALYGSQADIESLDPDPAALASLDCLGIIATAPGRDCDFVSRFFAPAAGIPEDPVTGSAHCTLIPFWAARLKKSAFHARQVSKRGGELFCRTNGSRVVIGGKAVIYSRGEIILPK